MLFYNYRIVCVPELPVILHFFSLTIEAHRVNADRRLSFTSSSISLTQLPFLIPRD